MKNLLWNILFFFGKIVAFFKNKNKYKVHFRTPRKNKRENKRYIDDLVKRTLSRSAIFLFTVALCWLGVACDNKADDPQPQPAPLVVRDTLVKFTLYSKRVPYIWKREIKGIWTQDTVKTNNAVKYEPYDNNNLGIGYWVTMNLAGISTDSLHIIGEYNGRTTQMSSLKGQSAAYVLLNAIGPK